MDKDTIEAFVMLGLLITCGIAYITGVIYLKVRIRREIYEAIKEQTK